jgi:hypothetical protein
MGLLFLSFRFGAISLVIFLVNGLLEMTVLVSSYLRTGHTYKTYTCSGIMFVGTWRHWVSC